MNFPVPWRSLLPVDAVPVVTGDSNLGLKDICDQTGAVVDISGEGETPPTLSDKICTISGSVEQKEAACRRIVDKLRVLQEVADQEPGVFVIIVPSHAAPAVVGQKGAQIKEVIELSGAEISVGKENILGMADQPIGITGTGGQVVSAVSKINAILQDLADRGRLQPSDFKWRQGAGGTHMEPSGGGARGPQPSGGNPRTHAKFVAPTQVAGWIIGKQGRHIRELQENSGAHIQVHKEGAVPPGVSSADRVIEIGGRHDAKAEGIQIVLMAIDSMPALQAPRETLMLIPKSLTTESEIKDVMQMSRSEVEVRDLPGHDESLCTLLGTIEARVKAAQQFLTRLEEMVNDGSAGDNGAAAEVHRQPASAPTPQLMRHEEPRREEFRREEPRREELRREEPRREEPRREPPREQARVEEPRREEAKADPWMEKDPWSTGPPKAPQISEPITEAPKAVSFREPEIVNYSDQSQQGSSNSWSPATARSAPPATEPPAQPDRVATTTTAAPSAFGGRSTTSTPPPATQVHNGVGESSWQTSFRPDVGDRQQDSQQTSQQTSFGQTSSMQTSFGPNGGSASGCGGSNGQTSFRPGGGDRQQTSFAPSRPHGDDRQGGNQQTSFGPHGSMQSSSSGPSGGSAPGTTTFSPGFGGMGGVGMGGIMSGGMGMGMMPGMGIAAVAAAMASGQANDSMFTAALQEANFASGPNMQLLLVLPQEALQKSLLPRGHLGEIAQKCRVRIDLGEELPNGLRQLSVTGSIVANALVAYFLQERVAQCITAGF